jgi:amino acid adenylation domain-containing protein
MEGFMASLIGNVEGGFPPDSPVGQISLVCAAASENLLALSTGTALPWPRGLMIHEVFEHQVKCTPDACAVVYETDTLTYAELNRSANRLAHRLRGRGVGPGIRVAICLDRSVEMVVALLGVLKAGGAYVPLDPAYPTERVAYMLEDAAPRLLITQQSVKEQFPLGSLEVLTLDKDGRALAEREDSNSDDANWNTHPLGLAPSHLAYVIYTSGSTGRPKGVMISHENLMSSNVARQGFYGNPGRFLLLSPLGFDSSVAGIFGTLTTGGTLLVATEAAVRDPAVLVESICGLEATCLLCVPSLYQRLLASSAERIRASALSRVIVAGEACPPGLISESALRTPGIVVFNEYGPTEGTVWATVFECTQTVPTGSVPIGRPIANARVYILDSHRQPVPIGVAGELYIGGAGVAQGYLNQTELTAERFVEDPFSPEQGMRLFKSGDLGRWRPDGNIAYLGRNDEQVKIRGFRIELGEIEAQLARHEALREVIVIVREGARHASHGGPEGPPWSDGERAARAQQDVSGDKRLVAYFTPRSTKIPSPTELRAHLKAVVPEYMIPSAFVLLERFPTTPNGKLDRRGLPAPASSAYASKPYEAPQGEVEETLAGVWQDLLQVEQIGRQDNFFELGGHSLLIAQMMERLRRLGFSADVRYAFKSRTLAEFARTLGGATAQRFEIPSNRIPRDCKRITPEMLTLVTLDTEQIEQIARSVPGGAREIQDIYPLTPLQEGILFHHLVGEQRCDTYVLQTLLEFPSRIDLDETIGALQRVIQRHDVLRTAVLWEQLPWPVQVVYRRASLPIETLVLDPDRDSVDQLKERLRLPPQRLDLQKAPLMRLWVAADTRSDQWYALLQTHHIACDQVSFGALMTEVRAHLEGRAQGLPEATPYRNHVAQALAHAGSQTAKSFFSKALSGIDEPTAPFGLREVHGDGTQIEESREEWPSELARRVRTEARRRSVSAATLFHAAWSLVVAVTSGRADVVFGTVLLGRLQDNAESGQALGMFINTLPLRVSLLDISASELVQQTQERLVELLGHEQASLAVAQRCSSITGTAPLFSALLNYRHYSTESDAQVSKETRCRVLTMTNRTNYPISLSVDDLGDGFAVTAHTNRPIDPRRVLGYTLTAMQSLVEALESAPQVPALSLAILPDAERQEIANIFHGSRAEFPHEKLLHELFEAQVERTPQALAVVFKEQRMTYATLNAKANQLARYLRDRGLAPDQLVALCVERSLEMIIGVLGVLKAGGAYVPLDPSYPLERLSYMLRDSVPAVVLTQDHLIKRLPETRAAFIALDRQWTAIDRYLTDNLDSVEFGLRPDHLAYVIYTSGSTGQPKGVMIEHRSVVNLWQGLDGLYGPLSSCRRIALNASINFDASLQQFVQLLSGRTLFIIPEDSRRDPSKVVDFIRQNQIDGVDCTPSQLRSWIAAGLFDHNGHQPSRALVGGEAIDTALWSQLAKYPETAFFNVYGPTECTVDATAGRLSSDAEPHIGRPMDNRRVYLLNRSFQPVPIGVAGEIYIGGEGVARGYLNRPELTTERFLVDPFGTDAHARLYKTGDLARWRPDGTLEYLGRNDDQVKIRGHRIELGEIEAQLRKMESVQETVVIAREHAAGEQQLLAYMTERDRGALSVEQIRAHLKTALPEHMLPSAFVILERLPLTSSGKVDRRALPTPGIDAYVRSHYEAPQGEVEGTLARIWQQLLKVERVGREDNFFDLGGHSLLAMQVLTRLRAAFSIAMPISVLFEYQTLKQLSAYVEDVRQADLLADIAQGGTEMKELLEGVASLSESKVQEWLRVMEMGGRP